jgi:hypothetical protein
MRVEMGRNDTVKVKVADATCLEYVKTYTPLFDCRSKCSSLLSKVCRELKGSSTFPNLRDA